MRGSFGLCIGEKGIDTRLNLWSSLGPPCGPAGKESVCNAGDLGSIPGLGRSPGEGKGYPLQYSSLENSMDYSPWDLEESDTTERLILSLVPQKPSRHMSERHVSLLGVRKWSTSKDPIK